MANPFVDNRTDDEVMRSILGYKPPPPPQPDTPLASDMATGFKRGLFTAVPEMIGGTMKALAPVGSKPYQAGQGLQDDAKLIAGLPEMQRSSTKRGIVGETLVAGAEGVGQMVPVIAGSLINPLVGAGVAGTMYGGSTYQDTKERMLKQEGIDDAYASANPSDPRVIKAKSTGAATGFVQGAGEAAMSYLGGRFLKGAFPKFGTQTAENVIAGVARPGVSTLKNFGKAWGTEMLGEGVTEVIQDEGQAAVERMAGLKDAPAFMAQAADSAKGGVGTALLLGPLAGAGHYKSFKDAQQVQQALEDPATEPLLRVKAAQVMGSEIAKVDEPAARNFMEHAYNAIGDVEETDSAPYKLDLNNPALLQPFSASTQDTQTARLDDIPDFSPPQDKPSNIAGTTMLHDSNPQIEVSPSKTTSSIANRIDNTIAGIIGERRGTRGASTMAADSGLNPVIPPDVHPALPALASGDTNTLLTSLGFPKIRNADHFETGGVGAIQNGAYLSPPMPQQVADSLVQNAGSAGLTASIEPYIMTRKKMDGTMESVPAASGRVIVRIQSTQGVNNGITNTVPTLQNQTNMDRAALPVSQVQADVSGYGSDISQPGGLTNDLPILQQKSNGAQTQVPNVRNEAVVQPVQVEAVKSQISTLREQATRLKSKRTVFQNGQQSIVSPTEQNLRDSEALFAQANDLENHWYAAIHPEELTTADIEEAQKLGMPVLASSESAIKIKTVTPEKLPAKRTLDTSSDDLMTAIALKGGISLDEASSLWGKMVDDVAADRRKFAEREYNSVHLRPIFSKMGSSIDDIGRSLADDGYIATDEHGKYIPSDLESKITAELSGTRIYSTHNTGKTAEAAYKEAESRYQSMIDDMTEEEYSELMRNQWLDEQAELLVEAEVIIDDHLSEQYDTNMTVADWQAVENDFKEAFDVTEFNEGIGGKIEGEVQAPAGRTTESVHEVINGDTSVEDSTEERTGGTEAVEVKGRDLFTAEQLAAFDEKGINVSGVTEAYKTEALQQLDFHKEQQQKLESPDYNTDVQAEYDRVAKEQAIVFRSGNGVIRKQGKKFEAEWNDGTTKSYAIIDDAKQGLMPGSDYKAPVSEKANLEKKPATKPQAKVADAGEELIYNKRNRLKGVKWDDIKDSTGAMKAESAQKKNVYAQPDYVTLVSDGMPNVVAHIVKQVYDSIAVAPVTRTTPTDADFQTYITAVNRVMDSVMSWAQDNEAVAAWAIKNSKGMGYGSTVSLSELSAKVTQPYDIAYPGGWRNFKYEVIILGGNKLLSRLQPGYDGVSRAIKDVMKGWPGKIASWQRQGYSIGSRDDLAVKSVKQSDGGERFGVRHKDNFIQGFDSMDEATAFIAGLKPALLIKKNYRIVDSFGSQSDAEAAAKKLATKEQKQSPEERGSDVASAERIGPARRLEGENVTSQQIIDAFGYRGINIGNWVPADEAQMHLNFIYDSSYDLAELLGVPLQAVSLNGTIGVAVGAQGGGKASAHYVPAYKEVNITRTKGAGAFIHELLGHGLDNYFGEMAGWSTDKKPYLSKHIVNNAEGTVRPEVTAAFRTIMATMSKRQETKQDTTDRVKRQDEAAEKSFEKYIARFESYFEGIPEDGKAEAARLFERLRNRDFGDGYVSISSSKAVFPVVADLYQLSRKYKVAPKYSSKISVDDFQWLHQAAYSVKRSVEIQEQEHTPLVVNTDYANASGAADKGKSANNLYWSTPWEVFARAVDAYVTDKIAERNQKNTYLSGLEAVAPQGEERKAINAAFDKLFATLETKETDKGVALYKHSEDATPTGLKVADIQHLASADKGIVTLQSIADAPAHIQEQMKRDNVQAAQGVYDPATDSVYLFADHIADVKEAGTVVLSHELTHKGLAALGAEGKQYLRAIALGHGKELSTIIVAAKEQGRTLSLADAANEFLAREGETKLNPKLWQRIVNLIKDSLLKLVGKKASDKDVRDILTKVREALRDDKTEISRAMRFVREVFTSSIAKGNVNVARKFKPAAQWLVELSGKNGLNITGYAHEIDVYGVKHIKKSHGDAKKEASRGQIAVTETDFMLIPAIVSAPDKVIYGLKSRLGKDEIGYLKELPDGTTLYFEEVRTGKGTLAALSLRKYPATMNVESILSTLDPNAQGDSRKGSLSIVEPPDTVKDISTGIQYMTAWHGSPANFDNFSTENIGEGEGAQAYGYGLYFAGSKDVANFYKDKLGRGSAVPMDVLERYFEPGRVVIGYGGPDKVVTFNKGPSPFNWSVTVHGVDKDGNRTERRDRTHSTMPKWSEVEKVTGDKPGKLYQVKLAPKENEYLLWDKPLSEQSDEVRTALQNAFDDAVNKESDYHKASYLSRIYADYAQSGDVDGRQAYNLISKLVAENESLEDRQKAASEHLHSLGIRGIKYLDGNSRGKGEGDYNYVIFNDTDVEIQAKFALAPETNSDTISAGGNTYAASELETSIIDSARKEDEGSALQRAADHLRRVVEAKFYNRATTPTRTGKATERSALRKWALENNLIIDRTEFDSAWSAQLGSDGKPIQGNEHDVIFNGDGTVTKRNRMPNEYHESYQELFDRVTLFNWLFGKESALALTGFMDVDGVLMPVFNQNLMKGPVARIEQTQNFLKENGFEPVGDKTSAFRVPGTDIIITDVFGNNTRVVNGVVFPMDYVVMHGERSSKWLERQQAKQPAFDESEIDSALENLKQSPSVTTGISANEVQQYVNTLPISNHVVVKQSVDEWPDAARAQVDKAGVDYARVKAMEYKGNIYVATGNIADMQAAKAIVWGHELAHAGQTEKITDMAVDWFKRTKGSKNEAVREIHQKLIEVAADYGYDLNNPSQFRRAVKEATAAIAEQAVEKGWKNNGLLARIFMYVKHWLRQAGLISHVSDKELTLAVAEMLRLGEKRLSTGKGGGDAHFALADKVSTVTNAVTAAVPDVVNHAKENWKQIINPLDWSRSARWFDNWTPDTIKAGFGWFFNNPFFEGLRDAAKKVFVEEGADRELNRMSLMLQMFGYKPGQEDKRTRTEKLKDFVTKWHSGVETTEWEKLNLRYLKMSKEQQNAMDIITAQGDINNTYYSSYRTAMLNRKNQAAKLSEETFNLYKDVYSHMQLVAKIREQQIEHMLLEAGRSKAEVDKTIKDYRKETREVAGWMTRNHGEGNFVTTVHHVVKDLKFTVRDIKDEGQQAFLPYYPGAKVMAEIEKLAAQDKATVTLTGKGAVVVTADKGQKLDGFMQAAQQIIPDLKLKAAEEPARLQKIRDKVAEKGSTPAVLAKIDKRIEAAKEAAKDPRIMVMVYSRRHDVIGKADKHAGEVRANLKKHMPEGYRNGEEYLTRSSQADTLNEEIFQNMPNDIAMQAGLEKAIEAALKHGEINSDEMDALKSRLIQDTAEVLLGRAAGKYQIRRAPYLIEGYDTANVMSGYQDYITGVAGMLSKAEYASKQFKHLTEAPIPVKPWAYKYVFDSLRNQGMADRLSGNARAFVSLWYMGLKPASAIINSTQIYTLGVAEIGRILDKGESAIVRIARAQKDTMGGKLSMDEKEIFDSAVIHQQEAATALSQITGHNEGGTGKASRILHNITGKAMALFQNIEVMNRKTIILAAYRILRDNKLPDGVIDHAALKQALEINNSVNFDQGRHNLPGWARKPLGQTLYALQSFTWNNLNWIYTRATSGEKRDMQALLRYTGMLMLIGGAGALAGGDELDRLYRKLFGKSLLMEAKQWTHRNAKQYGTLGELADAFAWHGVAGMAGFNISNSMRLQIPVASQMLGDATMPEAIGGVWAGLAKKAWLTTEALTKGDMYRAAESAAPEAIAGAMRAYRQYDTGMTTLKGRPVPDETGKPIKYSPLDAAKRIAGFQPLEQSRRMEVAMTGKEMVNWWKDERDDLLAKLRIAKPESRKEIMPKIVEFNREVRKSQAWGKVDIIKADTVRNALVFKPNKKDMAWQKNQMN